MMKILFDANIIVTFLTQRSDPFLDEIKTLFQLCDEGRVSGYVALQSVPIVWYILRKMPDDEKRNGLKFICDLLNLAVTDMVSVQRALDNTAFLDFEDNLQACCAQSVQADYIVTANVSDYGHSVIPAISPAEFMAVFEQRQNNRIVSSSPRKPSSLMESTMCVFHQVSIQLIRRHHHHLLNVAG